MGSCFCVMLKLCGDDKLCVCEYIVAKHVGAEYESFFGFIVAVFHLGDNAVVDNICCNAVFHLINKFASAVELNVIKVYEIHLYTGICCRKSLVCVGVPVEEYLALTGNVNGEGAFVKSAVGIAELELYLFVAVKLEYILFVIFEYVIVIAGDEASQLIPDPGVFVEYVDGKINLESVDFGAELFAVFLYSLAVDLKGADDVGFRNACRIGDLNSDVIDVNRIVTAVCVKSYQLYAFNQLLSLFKSRFYL